MFAGLNLLRSVFGTRAGTEARLLVINGHPDPRPERFCAALCASYAAGATINGYETRRLAIGHLIHGYDESGLGSDEYVLGGTLARAVETIAWADLLFVAFPMWLGKPPGALRLLFEAYAQQAGNKRKKAQLVVTASLPSLLYRSKSGKGEPLGEWATSLAGLDLAKATLIGSVDTISKEERLRWLAEIHQRASSGRWERSSPESLK